jgi:hypothetical protein
MGSLDELRHAFALTFGTRRPVNLELNKPRRKLRAARRERLLRPERRAQQVDQLNRVGLVEPTGAVSLSNALHGFVDFSDAVVRANGRQYIILAKLGCRLAIGLIARPRYRF